MSAYRFKAKFRVLGGHVHGFFFSTTSGAASANWQMIGRFDVRRGTEFSDLFSAMRLVTFVGEGESDTLEAASNDGGTVSAGGADAVGGAEDGGA